jgi:hypothetical protein
MRQQQMIFMGVIEESMMEEEYINPPGMLLISIGSKRLITYIYPLLLGMTFAFALLTNYQKNTDQ